MWEILLMKYKQETQGSKNFSVTAEMMWETRKYYNDGSQ